MPPKKSLGIPQITGSTPDELRLSTQFWMQQVFNHLDKLTGARGIPTFLSDINANGNNVINLPDPTANAATSSAAIPHKFALSLTRQSDGSLMWDPRAIPIVNAIPAVESSGVTTLQQVRDLINAALGLVGGPVTMFTLTGTGFAVNPTAIARYVLKESAVILFLPELTGTSNAPTFTLTGLPVDIIPTQTTNYIVTITDGEGGATDGYGLLRLVAGSAEIQMLSPVSADQSWTASGTKRLYATSITYAKW